MSHIMRTIYRYNIVVRVLVRVQVCSRYGKFAVHCSCLRLRADLLVGTCAGRSSIPRPLAVKLWRLKRYPTTPSHVGRVLDRRQARACRATLSGRVGNSVIANVTLFRLMRAKTIWKLSTRRYDLFRYKWNYPRNLHRLDVRRENRTPMNFQSCRPKVNCRFPFYSVYMEWVLKTANIFAAWRVSMGQTCKTKKPIHAMITLRQHLMNSVLLPPEW